MENQPTHNEAKSDSELVEIVDLQRGENLAGTSMNNPGNSINVQEQAILTWNNVTYSVKSKRKLLKKSGPPKQVLSNVSGYAFPGQLVAIMGSTGAGKSTLLDILVGIPKSGTITGKIQINGQPLKKTLRRKIGYVSQDDTLMATSTVEETLLFYANLRLPWEMSQEDKVAKVRRLLSELGLETVRNTKVGNSTLRGISGGERKRLSIGCEIVTAPTLLALDEPTSGLDSFASLSVMGLLSGIAANGTTVICTLHQPRISIFQLVSNLCILSQGKVVYFGPANSAEEHFQRLGFEHSPNCNVADFALDVTILQERGTSTLKERYLRVASQEVRVSDKENIVPLVLVYERSMQPNVESTAIQIATRASLEVKEKESEFATPWWYQTHLLIKRGIRDIIRDPKMLLAQLMSTIILSIILSTLFMNIGNGQETVQTRAGLLFAILISVGFSTEYVLLNFLETRPTYNRERTAKLYRSSSLYLSKLLVDLPFEILWPLLYGSIAYFIIGLHPGLGRFIIFEITLCLVVLVAASLFFAIATVSPNIGVAMALAPLILILFIFGAGFWVPFTEMPGFWKWLYYASFYRYGFQALLINEFTGLTFVCDQQVCIYQTGEQALTAFHISSLTIVENWIVLLGFFICLRILAFIFLVFLHRDKR